MGDIIDFRRGVATAACASLLAGLLASCAYAPGEPAPVYQRGIASTSGPYGPPPWHENKTVIVQHGQTVGEIAHANHVTERALIAANQLKPPYALHVGARLVIPDNGQHPPPQMAAAMPPPSAAVPPTTIVTAPPPPSAAVPPKTIAAAPSPPVAASPPPQTSAAPNPPRPAQPASQMAAAPAPNPGAPPVPPPSAQKVLPDIVPLDTPPKQVAAAVPAPATTPSGPPSVLPPRNAAAALPLPGETTPAVTTEAATGGRFPWPVNGRVLANYGAHNEGINIAAPRGTAVRAIDGGTVAYAGNEVKGYGNLVLVKHANGWISAYAHLDDVMVKKGDTVGAGQIIAKVGDSGGVGEPQLHFELRRGKKPVDPREFLAPAPSASSAGNKAG